MQTKNSVFIVQFPPLPKSFRIIFDNSLTLERNKNAILVFFLEKDLILKEIHKEITSYLSSNQTNNEKELLEKIVKKLEIKIKQLENENLDEPCQSSEFDEQEIAFFLKSMQISSHSESEDERLQKPINESKIPLQINFNFSSGCTDKPEPSFPSPLISKSQTAPSPSCLSAAVTPAKSSSSSANKTMPNMSSPRTNTKLLNTTPSPSKIVCCDPSFFICQEHDERITHYCLTCDKPICGLDIIPINNSNGMKSFLFFLCKK